MLGIIAALIGIEAVLCAGLVKLAEYNWDFYRLLRTLVIKPVALLVAAGLLWQYAISKAFDVVVKFIPSADRAAAQQAELGLIETLPQMLLMSLAMIWLAFQLVAPIVQKAADRADR